MSCSDTDPYCVSYPTLVFPLQQILVQIAAESIAYGMLTPQCICTQIVDRLFCYCCYSGNLSAYAGDSNSEIYWLTAEFRHQGIPSTTSKRCLLAAALLLFSTDTITYALNLVSNGIVNIKLGPFNADSGAVSLTEQLFVPNTIFIRINVSHTLVDLEHSYFYSSFVLMLLWCGGLGLYAKVHSPI